MKALSAYRTFVLRSYRSVPGPCPTLGLGDYQDASIPSVRRFSRVSYLNMQDSSSPSLVDIGSSMARTVLLGSRGAGARSEAMRLKARNFTAGVFEESSFESTRPVDAKEGSSETPVVKLRGFNRIKTLASALRLPNSKVLKDIAVSRRKKLYCNFGDVWFSFDSVNSIIVPFETAKLLAKHYGKNAVLQNPLDELLSDGCGEANNLEKKSKDNKSSKKLGKRGGEGETSGVSGRAAHVQVSESRIPVGVLLGHFNHGKTSILDTLGGMQGAAMAPRGVIPRPEHTSGVPGAVRYEPHGITQKIRTELVKLLNDDDTDNLSGDVSSMKYITLVDTPGQSIFYRMRNYGASVAEFAVLVVAADDGIGPQTEESIGLVESLGCPVVVAINKIDLVTPERVESVKSALQSYRVLARAPVIPVSTKVGTNMSALREELIRFGKSALSAGVEANNTNSQAISSSLHGTILDVWRSQRQGQVIHAVLHGRAGSSSGKVRRRDWFTAGGWAGYVSGMSINDNEAEIESAGAGQAVHLRVSLKSDLAPLPLQDTIRFVDEETALAAAEQRNMEVSLASHAITPDDAAYFRLADYARATIQYKYNLMSIPDTSIGQSTLSPSEDSIGSDEDTEDGNISDAQAVIETMLYYGDGKSATKRVPSEGAGGNDQIPKVVLKTDTAVSLGTVLDAIEEFEERSLLFNPDNGAGGSDGGPKLTLSRRIVRGEAGIVTTSDVHIATAAGGPIVAFNVAVDANAARLAQSKGVVIEKYTKLEDVIDSILPKTSRQYCTVR